MNVVRVMVVANISVETKRELIRVTVELDTFLTSMEFIVTVRYSYFTFWVTCFIPWKYWWMSETT